MVSLHRHEEDGPTAQPLENLRFHPSQEASNDPLLDFELLATMAAANGFLDPPAPLRERILQATAPAPFHAPPRHFPLSRWTAIAACLLVTLGWNHLRQQSRQLQNTRQELAQSQLLQQEQLRALTLLLNPNVHPIHLREPGKDTITGLLLKDGAESLVVLPQAQLPAQARLRLTLREEGHERQIVTSAIGLIPPTAPKPADPLPRNLEPSPDPRTARLGG